MAIRAASILLAFLALLSAPSCTRADDRPPAASPTATVAGGSAPDAEMEVPPAASLDPLPRVIAAAQGDGRGAFLAPKADERERFIAISELLARAATARRTAAPVGSTATAGPLGLPAAFAPIGFWNGRAAALGLEFAVLHDTETLVVVRESDGVRRGSGVFTLRPRAAGAGKPPRPLVIEAPHCFFDSGTGEIARDLFERTQAVALAMNTVHRYLGQRKPAPGGDAPADCAHAEATYFQAFTIGCSRALDRAVFVEIHGFAAGEHAGLAQVDIVASKGEAGGVADPVFDALVGRLRAMVGAGRVAVYGKETRELGATTNAQGRFINAYSDDLFYHLEMSHGLRTRLLGDAALRARFAEAIGPLAEAPP